MIGLNNMQPLMNLILGITGSRKGDISKVSQKLREIQLASPEATFELHHGDCVGVDEEAHRFASSEGWKIVIHPPDKPSLRAFCKSEFILEGKPYLKRNHNIVDSCAILLAFPETAQEITRSGTWATIRYARKKEKTLEITPLS